jgi:hypothetical protein
MLNIRAREAEKSGAGSPAPAVSVGWCRRIPLHPIDEPLGASRQSVLATAQDVLAPTRTISLVAGVILASAETILTAAQIISAPAQAVLAIAGVI